MHDSATSDPKPSPTLTIGGTREGSILGTAAYMSPEQARGLTVDKRTDVWAFGCVFYEMLTGRAPFVRDTVSDTIGAILHVEPQWQALPKQLPDAIRRLLKDCLEKDANKRPTSAREMRTSLDGIHQNASPRRRVAFAAVVGLMLLMVAAVWLWRSSFQVEPGRPERITNFPDSAVAPSFSPDGRMMTFIRGSNTFIGDGQIYVKVLPDGEPRQLTRDTLRKMHPVFSPDGSKIAYTGMGDSGSWDTWIVPLVGGEPRLWLPNASGFSWIGQSRVLFSEVKDHIIHMALVSSTEARSEARDVYVPQSVRGMAHRSYLSPDRKWVLAVEMENGWLPCRLVPFDGSSPGRPVGPTDGRCTYAAWSPDGRWMYFSSDASGSMQIWRQRFPDGYAEQLTNGPTAAEGIAIAPDGRSLVTSLGMDQRSVWIHENGSDRQISGEGNALLPAWGDGFPTSLFSPDGKRIHFLVQGRVSKQGFGGGELWSADLASGTSEPVLPGISMTTFDLSRDGQRVVFGAVDSTGKSQVWLAHTDRRSPPRLLVPTESRGPVFADDHTIFFRGPDGPQWYIHELSLDSSTIRRFVSEPAVNSPVVSPDGQWIVSWTPQAGAGESSAMPSLVKAYPRNGGTPVVLCRTMCFVKWTRDMRFIFVSIRPNNNMGSGQTRVIQLEPGGALPSLPPEGITSDQSFDALRVVATVDEPSVAPGVTRATYAFERHFVQRNLYRISLP